jgi:hypothetical protein
MSLRIFHIVFVTVSVLLAIFVGVWGVRTYLATREAGWLALGILFFVSGAVLVVYGTRVYRKLKELP